MIADIPQHLQDGAYSQPRIAVGLARNRFGREGGGGDAGGEGGRGWKVQGTYLLTHLTIMVPTAMLCAASSIHHSPLSHRELPEDTFCPTSSVKSGWATGNSPAHATHVALAAQSRQVGLQAAALHMQFKPCPASSLMSGRATGNSPAHASLILPSQLNHVRQGYMQQPLCMHLTAMQLHEMYSKQLCSVQLECSYLGSTNQLVGQMLVRVRT